MDNGFYVQPTKPNEIYHYGIKRRSGRYPWGSGGRPYQRLNRSTAFYKTVDDVKIKKNTILNRVGSSSEKDTGRTYASLTEDDKLRYINIAGNKIRGTELLELKALLDIDIAGTEAQIDSFLEVVGEYPIEAFLPEKEYYQYTKRTKFETDNSKRRRKEESKKYKKMLKTGDMSSVMEDFSKNLQFDTDITNAFFKKLEEKGYDGLVDMHDKKAADLPIIIFKRGESVKTISSRKITQEEKDAAMVRYVQDLIEAKMRSEKNE